MKDSEKIVQVLKDEVARLRNEIKHLEQKSIENIQANRLLDESEELYRTIIQNQGEGVGIVDAKERFIFTNPAGDQIFGVKPGGLIGRRLSDFLDPDEWQKVLVQTNARKTGERSNYELTIIRPDKTRRIISVTATPKFEENGEYAGAFGIFMDISKRKHTEEALRRSEERFRRMADNIQDVLWRVDLDGVVLYVNKSVNRILGLSKEETDHMPPEKYLPTDSIEQIRQWVRDALFSKPQKESFRGEVDYLHKDGHRVPCELNVTLVRNVFGRVVALDGVTRDISLRIKREKEQAELLRNVYTVQRNESIGILAGGIAHDYNNALQVISGALRIAFDSVGKSHKVRTELNAIDRAVKKMAGWTSDLLAFSRGKPSSKLPISVNDCLANAIKIIDAKLMPAISLQVDLEEDLPKVPAVNDEIQQVFVNILVNAIEAIDGSGTISVKTRRVKDLPLASSPDAPSAESFIHVLIEDDGPGMEPWAVQRIFDPFFTTKFIGRGMGMAVVYGIIKVHNGQIVVNSSPNAGTMIDLYFPVISSSDLIIK